jgi:hypothetical protein
MVGGRKKSEWVAQLVGVIHHERRQKEQALARKLDYHRRLEIAEERLALLQGKILAEGASPRAELRLRETATRVVAWARALGPLGRRLLVAPAGCVVGEEFLGWVMARHEARGSSSVPYALDVLHALDLLQAGGGQLLGALRDDLLAAQVQEVAQWAAQHQEGTAALDSM